MQQVEHARLQGGNGEAVMLEGVKVAGDLRGLLFEASVEQAFRNAGDKAVEVVYTFPLPWGAVLMDMTVVLGGRRLTGAVVEKGKAEARYEEVLSEGDSAIMLERNHDRSHTLNLGNLAPQEACVLTLRYAQTLQFEQRGLRLLLPTVIAPRYGDAVLQGGLQPHQAPAHDLLADYPFDIALRLHGDLARARVASPSHRIAVAQDATEAGAILTVSLARRGALDRDFVLVVDRLIQDSVAVAAHDAVAPEGVAVLASFCPRIAPVGDSAIAAKVLVDCSGSMAGDSIEAARRALQAIVGSLGKEDRFSLSRFGDGVVHRSRGLWKVTETSRLAAQRWVGELAADLGGTQMEAALASTFALARTVPADVLLVTDGQIAAIESTIAAARNSSHRMFIVGIGSSPAEMHLRRLAEATGGACDFVAPGEAVEPAVLRMFARLRTPRVHALQVQWPDAAIPDWASDVPAVVFDGDTLNVCARFGTMPEGEVRLLGARREGGAAEIIARARIAPALRSGDTLPRMVAWQRVAAIDAAGGPSTHDEQVRLAVDYLLVTQATNFLLVHERAQADKAADMPVLHKVRAMIPAGWGGTGSVRQDLLGVAFCMPSAPLEYDMGVDMLSLSMDRERFEYNRAAGFAPRAMSAAQVQPAEVDRNDPMVWTRSPDYTGLTPEGLFMHTIRRLWAPIPASLDELRFLGVGEPVLRWLEQFLHPMNAEPPKEAAVIGTLLITVWQVLEICIDQSIGAMTRDPATVLGEVTDPDTPAARGLIVPVDRSVAERMLAAMKTMRADRWPDGMLDQAASAAVGASTVS